MLKAVLSEFGPFHAGNSHFWANRGGAVRREQPGVPGVARGGARRCALARSACTQSWLVAYMTLASATVVLLQFYGTNDPFIRSTSRKDLT